jgi:hypothetical protein
MTQYSPEANGTTPKVLAGSVPAKTIRCRKPSAVQAAVAGPIKQKTEISRAFPYAGLSKPAERLRVMRLDKMYKATLDDGHLSVTIGDPGLNICIGIMGWLEDVLASKRPAFAPKHYPAGVRLTATDIGIRMSLLMRAQPEPGAERYRTPPNVQLLEKAMLEAKREKFAAADGRTLTADEAPELYMNGVVEKVRELAKSPQYRERQRIWKRDVDRHFWLMYHFVNERLRGRREVIFACVRLGYEQPRGLKELQHDRDRLLNNLRGNTTFDACFAYVWMLDVAPLKGYYLEFIFLFEQRPQTPDLPAFIGDYWARLVLPDAGERFARVSTQTQTGVPDVHIFQDLMPEQRMALSTALAAHMVLGSQHVRPDVPPRTKPFGYGAFGR